jgi:hypothetical protein
MATKRTDLQKKEIHGIKLQNNDKLYILNISSQNHSPTHSPIFHTLNRDNKTQIAKHGDETANHYVNLFGEQDSKLSKEILSVTS